MPHIPMQIKIKMHCSKNMPAEKDIEKLSKTLSKQASERNRENSHNYSNGPFTFIHKINLVPRVSLLPIPGEREAETLVWVGNVSWRIEIAREWTSNLKAFVPLLLSKSKQGSRMFSSLQFAISNTCYSSISLKAKQVKCLLAIYCCQM